MTTTIGELLVREHIISSTQLAQALSTQKKKGGRLGEVLVEHGFIGNEVLERFFRNVPPVPRKIAQTGLSDIFLIDLMLKTTYFEGGVFTMMSMSQSMRLSSSVVDELADMAKAERLISIRSASGLGRASHIFELTELGRQRAEAAISQSQYAGPVPVTLQDYSLMVAHQSIRQIDIDEHWVRNALSQLVLNDSMIMQLGPALNSGRSVFLYGPPGTGKSSIAEAMGRELPGEIFIPHAIVVDEQIIRVFDAETHTPIEAVREKGPQLDVDASLDYDPRWVRCRRPVVMVGGELEMTSLDLEYNTVSKFYEAPIHMKASNGVFILDDFGRQMVAPKMLLNRWIVPLERGTDFLSLHTGKKFEVPFDQISIFCTNLKPSELVDEAFLRRIRHKIKVNYQTEAEYIEILRQVCLFHGIEFDAETAEYLVDTYYRKTGRPFVGSHPRDLVDQILDRARFMKIKPALTKEGIDAAAANYFVEL